MYAFRIAFPSDSLNYYNGVLPDGEPDNIVFVNDVAWGGGDSLSMPVAYVYGHDVYPRLDLRPPRQELYQAPGGGEDPPA